MDNDDLRTAIGSGDTAAVQRLIDAGADIRYQLEHGYDAIINASYALMRSASLLPMLQLLIAGGVGVNGQTSYSESGLSVLSRCGRFDGVKLLLESGANPAYIEFTPLMEAVAFGRAEDVQSVLTTGYADLEARDWWERTAWIIAVQTGEIAKAQLLLDAGCDKNARGRCGQPALFYAIEGDSRDMLRWLLQIGIDITAKDQFGSTSLDVAVKSDSVDAVELLLNAGANVNERVRTRSRKLAYTGDARIDEMLAKLRSTRGDNEDDDNDNDDDDEAPTALHHARSRDVALRLLQAGADPKDLDFTARRAILGLMPESDESLLTATPAEYRRYRIRRFGKRNPDAMNNPFWESMIRSGVNAYQAQVRYDGDVKWHSRYKATWCAQRFGQSLTFLPDGRIVQVAGEHEDGSDPDFCIYNDVFVHDPDGSITIYGYPESVFPPTDFHTATLIENCIYLVGSLGYSGHRHYGETPVYRLDTASFTITPLATTGVQPGWIYGHRAVLGGEREIEISGGKWVTAAVDGGREQHVKNADRFVLDIESLIWRRRDAAVPAGRNLL